MGEWQNRCTDMSSMPQTAAPPATVTIDLRTISLTVLSRFSKSIGFPAPAVAGDNSREDLHPEQPMACKAQFSASSFRAALNDMSQR